MEAGEQEKQLFCHKLKNHISTSWNTAYIDAFRIDSCDQPLIAVLAEVLKLVPDTKERTNYRKKLAPLVRGAFKAGLQIGTKVLTRNSLEEIEETFNTEFSKDTEKLVEDGSKTLTDKAIEQFSESLLKEQEEAEKNLKMLRCVLTDICTNRHHVIFIDELDRCRPDFSIKLLETIKHVFDVPNLSFVLVANTSILKASIQHHYGKDVDAEGYLDKFIGFKFTLPTLHRSQSDIMSEHASFTYFTIEVQKKDVLEICVLLNRHTKLFKSLISHNKISLRSVEKFVRNLAFYQVLAEDEGKGLNPEISDFIKIQRILAIFIFTVNEELSDSVARGILPYEDFRMVLGNVNYGGLGEVSAPRNELEVLQHLLLISGQGIQRSGVRNASIKKNFDSKYQLSGVEINDYAKPIPETMRLLKHLSNTY